MYMTKEDFQKKDGKTFPGNVYVETLLKPIFYDQKEYLFEAMFKIHKAHTQMLAEQDIITDTEKEDILKGVNRIQCNGKEELHYSPQYEDLFFLVESKIGDLIGDDLAGKMHIAKSRNDMGEAMYRIVLRDRLKETKENLENLCRAILLRAEEHVKTIMPAHTHTQPAQPTTLSHYLLAMHDNMSRDIKRLEAAFDNVNKSPMGAAAITTTGFPINRERMAELLGFEGLIENAYDAIGGSDYLIDAAQSLVSVMTNLGRWLQEFLRLASKEVGLLKVSDAYVQISSIMPQKRNPVSIEHSRSIASSAAAEGLAVIHMIHNTPYGDINDTEDDLQPHLYQGFNKANRVLRLVEAVVLTFDFNVERAAEQAKQNMITITEFADLLAEKYGVSFRKAHHVASVVSKNAIANEKELYEISASQINKWIKEDGQSVEISEQDWLNVTDPFYFIERRKVTGGTNPDVVRKMLLERMRR